METICVCKVNASVGKSYCFIVGQSERGQIIMYVIPTTRVHSFSYNFEQYRFTHCDNHKILMVEWKINVLMHNWSCWFGEMFFSLFQIFETCVSLDLWCFLYVFFSCWWITFCRDLWRRCFMQLYYNLFYINDNSFESLTFYTIIKNH